MNVLYGTSALIALFIEAHPFHQDADTTHLTFSNTDAQIYTFVHSIAEVFSTLTAGKAYLKFSASDAKELIDYNIIPNFATVELDTKDYLTTLEYLAEHNLTSSIQSHTYLLTTYKQHYGKYSNPLLFSDLPNKNNMNIHSGNTECSNTAL